MAMNVSQFQPSDNFNMAEFNDKISEINSGVNGEVSALNTRINEGAKIETGTYVGTGTYGSGNPRSLTFDFEPKLVLISTAHYLASASDTGRFSYTFGVFVKGASAINVVGDGQHSSCDFTMGGNKLSLYSNSGPESQFNSSSYTYYYVAMG